MDAKNKEAWIKILKGAGIAVAGSLLVYGVNVVVPFLSEYPVYGPIVASLASILINAARKWLEAGSAK